MSKHPGQIEIDALTAEIKASAPCGSVGELVRQAAREHGDRVAVDWFQSGVTLSFSELDRGANRIAANLLARNHRKGAHIAVMLPNSPAFLLAWFAIAKIGAVMVPVNTAYGGAELDYILNQSDAQALIIHQQFLPALAAMQKRPDLLSDADCFVTGPDGIIGELETGAALAEFDPGYAVTPDDIAGLQYTSGTTGFPKGCMLTQDYWMLMAHIGATNFRRRGIDMFLFWAPFFYMDGQWLLLASLRCGGTAFLPDKMSLTRFLGWVHDTGAQYCVLPEPILKATPPAPRDRDIPLKYVNAFGWRPSARAEAEARFNLIARDSFGMTEVGAAILLPDAAGEKLAQNTCGLAGPWRETRVMGEDGHECAPGEPGELQIRGRSIMLGYYKRPEANAESFDDGWFRTGDLFVKDADGYHRIVGRLKEMIKRAGENISASEVEAALREAPEITEAAAIAVPDERRREEVMVLIKLADDVNHDEFGPDAIKAHATSRLAGFKQPRYLAYVDGFPRTPTGKIAKPRIDLGTARHAIFDLQENRALGQQEREKLFPS
jgi:long-chain acyl-CoA synthetase